MAIRDNLKQKIIINTGGGGSGGGSGGGGGSSAIEGGYTVNFYNADKVLIESHSALCGMWIDQPISYTTKAWCNENGYVNQFPLTVEPGNEGAIFNLYAQDALSCAEMLYDTYGVDANEYPYLAVQVAYNDDITIIFGKSYSVEDTSLSYFLRFTSECLYAYSAYFNVSGKDLTNASDIAKIFISANLSLENSQNKGMYINHSSNNCIASNIYGIASKSGSYYVDLHAGYVD